MWDIYVGHCHAVSKGIAGTAMTATMHGSNMYGAAGGMYGSSQMCDYDMYGNWMGANMGGFKSLQN